MTLPLLSVLLDDSVPGHAEMLALSRKEQLSAEEVDVLMAYAVEHGGIDYARSVMAGLRDEAVEALSVFPDSEIKSSLVALLDYVISRSK